MPLKAANFEIGRNRPKIWAKPKTLQVSTIVEKIKIFDFELYKSRPFGRFNFALWAKIIFHLGPLSLKCLYVQVTLGALRVHPY